MPGQMPTGPVGGGWWGGKEGADSGRGPRQGAQASPSSRDARSGYGGIREGFQLLLFGMQTVLLTKEPEWDIPRRVAKEP